MVGVLPDYRDILALTDREPDWWDGNGTPRYAPFHPQMLGVYDHSALLVHIECQSCRRKFLVGDGWPSYGMHADGEVRNYDLDAIAAHYHYGDPPCHGCMGDTMNCIDIEIVEAWKIAHDTVDKPGVGKVIKNWNGWKRRPDLEGPIPDRWAD